MEELRINYEFKDILDAHVLAGRKGMFLTSAFVAIAAVLLDLFGDPLLALCLFVVGSPAGYLLYYLLLYYSARQNFKNAPLKSEVTLRFCNSFFIQKSMAGEAKVQWVQKVKSSPRVLLFYMAPGLYTAIPRRVCTDDAQYARLIALGELLTSGTPSTSSTPPSETSERT